MFGFDLSSLFLLRGLFFFVFLVWVSSSCFLFVFFLCLFWISGFLPSCFSLCSLGFFIVASFDLFMELESIMLDFHA